ncbi:MAG TPA: hypothetical protein P5560_03175 [Thermotogota bacterium]|nr:hypothetical protein [Thermotogota bacterium]HRW91932.1 hypothetical protein [Thermotogota bacterium]
MTEDREQLLRLLHKKVHVSGYLERFGIKQNRRGACEVTILLQDVRVTHQNTVVFLDHIWTSINDKVLEIDPCQGSKFRFDATVGMYTKFDRKTKTKSTQPGVYKISKPRVIYEGYGPPLSQFLRTSKEKEPLLNLEYS